MDKYYISGGIPLCGEIDVHGAKNSSLPLLAATVLGCGETVLHNCPSLSDVDASCKILTYLGAKVVREEDRVLIDTASLNRCDVPDDLMSEMRSSIILGAMIGRMGKGKMTFPGGCELGPRPIDLHLSALRQLGVQIKEEHGCLDCSVDGRLKGCKIVLSFPSVGATENILLAAATAEGETVIANAATEPEIVDLAEFLGKCGAEIQGAGESTIVIRGVTQLHGAEHTVISDRIAAATYLCFGAVTGGEILLHRTEPKFLESMIPVLEQTGCRILTGCDTIYLKAPKTLKAIKTVRTLPYPGFPTDAQAPIMAVATIADGTSVFVENIFENRYKHTAELIKMVAKIKVEGKVAVVEGVDSLSGANVKCTDLRGGAALVTAALAARGETVITELHHIDRGYANLEKVIQNLGGTIRRQKS